MQRNRRGRGRSRGRGRTQSRDDNEADTRSWRQDMKRNSQRGVGLRSLLASRYGKTLMSASQLRVMNFSPYLDAKNECKPIPRYDLRVGGNLYS